jgi:uncharacterized LabA/DUF88 family protein
MAEEAAQTPQWVAVLLDWQNVYNCAREAFGLENSPSNEGTVDPLKLARHLAGGVGEGRSLQEVRIYRGRPDNAKDSRGYSAWRSQTSAWQRSMGNILVPRYRDLKYRGSEVMEKGIDVWLAIDLVRFAMTGSDVDRVAVVSSDTDLVPALELAVEVRGPEFVEVAGWHGSATAAPLLAVEGVRQHRLDQTLHGRLRDDTDYNIPIRVRKRSGWDAQIQAEGRKRRD